MAGERRGLRKVRRHRLTPDQDVASAAALTVSELVAEVRAASASRRAAAITSDAAGRASLEYVSSAMPRLRTLALVALIVVVTDVTWDGKSLRISLGLPGRRRIIELAFP